jgi:TPR repeat protein
MVRIGGRNHTRACMFRIARSRVIAFLMLFMLPIPAAGVTKEKFNCQDLPQLKMAANDELPKAQATLSKVYLGGVCVPKDDVEAAKWARLSAKQGDPQGEVVLATILNRGWGVPRDDVEALKWARLSAKQGNVPGMDYLALMLHRGEGTPKDDVDALKWARLSAEQADAQGESLIALILTERPRTRKNDAEAVKWARLSAEQGHLGSQFILGTMYQEGRGGLPKDCVEADKWYILAERDRDAPKDFTRARMENELHMSKEEIAEAQRRADAWEPKPEPIAAPF